MKYLLKTVIIGMEPQNSNVLEPETAERPIKQPLFNWTNHNKIFLSTIEMRSLRRDLVVFLQDGSSI